MSLTFDGFIEAHKQWGEMDKRLNKLIGFNPATSNHYGSIQLYNHYISEKTTDEEILEIRAKYVQWKKDISRIFKEKHLKLGEEEFNELFSGDPMFGTIFFLGITLDLNKSMEYYRGVIDHHFQGRRR